MAELKTSSSKLTIKTKDNGTSVYTINDGALLDEILDTATAIRSLQDGELSGYFKTVVYQIVS